MRACGIPAPRALAPVPIICAVAAPLYFVLNDTIVPQTTKYYHQVQSLIRGDSRIVSSSALWYRAGNFVYQADALDSSAGTADNIRIYELSSDGRPINRVDAVEARHIGRGMWRLSDPIHVSLADGNIQAVDADHFAELGKDLNVMVNTRHLSIAALGREIEEIEARGMNSTHLKVDYYVKWAAPLSCIVLPAIALLFAVGGSPPPSAGFTGIISIVVAVTFILATGVSSSLGYGKGLPPMVAGWGPPGLFGLIALYLVFRLRKH
jgi:lipopolysaccharide export LptBFGC system permease protein LptF